MAGGRRGTGGQQGGTAHNAERQMNKRNSYTQKGGKGGREEGKGNAGVNKLRDELLFARDRTEARGGVQMSEGKDGAADKVQREAWTRRGERGQRAAQFQLSFWYVEQEI